MSVYIMDQLSPVKLVGERFTICTDFHPEPSHHRLYNPHTRYSTVSITHCPWCGYELAKLLEPPGEPVPLEYYI
jgi:hypothetical protein